MTLQEIQRRIAEQRPMTVSRNGKMVGYLLNEKEYKNYCRMMLLEVSKEISASAKKRGLTKKKLEKLLADDS